MEFSNVYEDARRADAYAKLEFPGTYYLAYRDIPEIIAAHITDKNALDFGCGTGRSTRFLKKLGFDAAGVDISGDMVSKAREFDPEGKYRVVADGDLGVFDDDAYDLILSAFTFDNVPTMEQKVKCLSELRRLLNRGGRIVNLVSSPVIYTHEWLSFTTKDFPENRDAKSGDKVKIIMTDVDDRRPVEDVIWSDDAYLDVYKRSGLEIVETYRPLGREDETFKWVTEKEISPWVIYVLKKS
jgi:SAM-dependent methyltransferase